MATRVHGDEVVFESHVVNVGSVPAHIRTLCYPTADAPVINNYYGIGPDCYGGDVTLAPRDSLRILTGGTLRGAAGNYSVHVHPIDRPIMDATVELKVVPLEPSALPPFSER